MCSSHKGELTITSWELTLYTLTSLCIFSILFSIHFQRCWQGEFLYQSKAFLDGDHFLYSCDLNVWFRGWYCKEKLDARHSSEVKGFIKQNQFGGPGSSYFYVTLWQPFIITSSQRLNSGYQNKKKHSV